VKFANLAAVTLVTAALSLPIGPVAGWAQTATSPTATSPDTSTKPATGMTPPAATAMPKAPLGSSGATSGVMKATKAHPLDINSASVAELDALPGIGEARSKAIIAGRPYKGKDELVQKKIIPQNVYSKIKDVIIAKQS
jgi:DNA uptake protein ComE-like DNA-binding protein